MRYNKIYSSKKEKLKALAFGSREFVSPPDGGLTGLRIREFLGICGTDNESLLTNKELPAKLKIPPFGWEKCKEHSLGDHATRDEKSLSGIGATLAKGDPLGLIAS